MVAIDARKVQVRKVDIHSHTAEEVSSYSGLVAMDSSKPIDPETIRDEIRKYPGVIK